MKYSCTKRKEKKIIFLILHIGVGRERRCTNDDDDDDFLTRDIQITDFLYTNMHAICDLKFQFVRDTHFFSIDNWRFLFFFSYLKNDLMTITRNSHIILQTLTLTYFCLIVDSLLTSVGDNMHVQHTLQKQTTPLEWQCLCKYQIVVLIKPAIAYCIKWWLVCCDNRK